MLTEAHLQALADGAASEHHDACDKSDNYHNATTHREGRNIRDCLHRANERAWMDGTGVHSGLRGSQGYSTCEASTERWLLRIGQRVERTG